MLLLVHQPRAHLARLPAPPLRSRCVPPRVPFAPPPTLLFLVLLLLLLLLNPPPARSSRARSPWRSGHPTALASAFSCSTLVTSPLTRRATTCALAPPRTPAAFVLSGCASTVGQKLIDSSHVVVERPRAHSSIALTPPFQYSSILDDLEAFIEHGRWIATADVEAYYHRFPLALFLRFLFGFLWCVAYLF